MNVLLTITYINGTYDTFDIYTSNGISDILYDTNVNKMDIINGYQLIDIPNNTTLIKIISNSEGCSGNITTIDIVDTNYMYIKMEPNLDYTFHMSILLDPGIGPYQVIQEIIEQFNLTTTDTDNFFGYHEVYLSGTLSINTTYTIIDNIINIVYTIPSAIYYSDIYSLSVHDFNLLINNGDNNTRYQFSIGSNTSFTYNEIINSNKKYINTTKNIE